MGERAGDAAPPTGDGVSRSTADLGIVAPLVHLNGTAGGDLANGYRAACIALDKAREALRATCPNGRDYYRHADPGAMAQATREHDARCARLRAVGEELEALLRNVREQVRP